MSLKLQNHPSTSGGLTELNSFLSTRSYLEGYAPSQADNSVFTHMSNDVDGNAYPHALRWSSHISSFPQRIRES